MSSAVSITNQKRVNYAEMPDTVREPITQNEQHVKRVLAVPLILLGLLMIAALDQPVAEFFRDIGFAQWIDKGKIAWLCKFPGNYGLTVVCAIFLLIFHPQTWRTAGMTMLAGVAGLINGLLKWISGRSRPFTGLDAWDWDFFHKGLKGLFDPTNLSFASGHSCMAFAWATVMSIAIPPFRVFFYTWATLTALQRVTSTDHYLSDAVVGAAIGVVTVKVIHRILSALMPVPVKESPVGPDWNDYKRFNFVGAELLPMSDTTIHLSLVIPCYNEEENVPTLLERVAASLALIGKPFEVILVDDGSTDKTPELLKAGQEKYPWLRVVRMKKNAGQSAGFEAGFAAARGEYIATIDADLQNDPEEVPRLLKLLEESPDIDMINGWRKDRQDTNFRRWQSRQANRIRNWISEDDINDSACSLKVYRANTLKGLKLFNGAHRFFPALLKMRGFKVQEIPVKHSARFAGTAKYGFSNRALRAFVDLLAIRWMKKRYLRYETEEKTIGNQV